MSVLARFLKPAIWADLALDTLYSEYDASAPLVPSSLQPVDVYQPATWIPRAVVCRSSDSERRLENEITHTQLAAGPWGSLFQVSGGGAAIGAVLEVADTFKTAYVSPDCVHLTPAAELPPESTVKSVYEGKTLKLFRLGPIDDGAPHQLIVVTKARWFRARANPKFLGFSKDEKP